MNDDPQKLHLFYNAKSRFEHGIQTKDTTTMGAEGQANIRAAIAACNYSNPRVVVYCVDSQPSSQGGVIVQSSGAMNHKGEFRRFSQTFFLAEQANGYYILNDIMRYIDLDVKLPDDDSSESEVHLEVEEPKVVAPLQPVLKTAPTAPTHTSQTHTNGMDQKSLNVQPVVQKVQQPQPVQQIHSQNQNQTKATHISQHNQKVVIAQLPTVAITLPPQPQVAIKEVVPVSHQATVQPPKIAATTQVVSNAPVESIASAAATSQRHQQHVKPTIQKSQQNQKSELPKNVDKEQEAKAQAVAQVQVKVPAANVEKDAQKSPDVQSEEQVPAAPVSFSYAARLRTVAPTSNVAPVTVIPPFAPSRPQTARKLEPEVRPVTQQRQFQTPSQNSNGNIRSEEKDKRSIYIRNLGDSIDKDALHEEFSKMGSIVHLDISDNGKSQRQAFIEFGSVESATKSIGSTFTVSGRDLCPEERKKGGFGGHRGGRRGQSSGAQHANSTRGGSNQYSHREGKQ